MVIGVAPTIYSIELSELDRVHEFNRSLADIDNCGLAGLDVDALDVDATASSLGFSLLSIVIADASSEGLTASG